MKSFINQFNEKLPALTKIEEKIARFILENPESAVKMSVQLLAEKAGAAPSTVIKMCRKLGFSGFSELKLTLASEINLALSRNVNFDDLQSTFGNYNGFVAELIEAELAHLKSEELEKASKILSDARYVDIYSFGFDSIEGLDLYHKLVLLGKRVQHIENGYMQMISASRLKEGDAVIAISSTGTSRDLHAAVKHAKHFKAKVISIAPESSILSEEADVSLSTYFKKLILRDGGIATRIVQAFVIDELFIRVLKRDEKAKEYYEKFKEVLDLKRR
ncbi:hypothetical protein AT15_01120 [Kosmotoga arenicorallina S304]|uniref:RpiR family transcriptional regulator n=1 Tax=Kosmotoga arenicorallina S304 TaxID=1453497 RepID=A0A176K0K1_9BACT|nr:MurR/RpiR family transcriptional regulator [Kosmotoga arenicorallina]OAA30148.1 hypothetical protein AT15_01120 [Kosmotoga arenicorallina S304]